MKRLLFLLILALPVSGTTYAALSELATLQSAHSDRYVRAGMGKDSYLAAVSPHIKAWETFKLIKIGGDKVALQSVHSGKYVRAGVGPESYLAAVSLHIKALETFKLIKIGGDKVALQSVHSGKYVRAGVGPESHLAAISPHIKAWETFKLVTGEMISAEYANIAVAQNKQNISKNFGLSGPRWSSDYKYHFNWAMGSNIYGKNVIGETIARINELRQKGVGVPPGMVPVEVSVKSIQCIEETDESGSDEPYILGTAVDLGPNNVNIKGVSIPIDVSVLAPHVEATLYGPWDPVWAGETHHTSAPTISASSEPLWGPEHKPKLVAHPDDVILIIAMMENDDGSPESARSLVKSTAVGTLAGSVQMNRNSRVKKLIKDIDSVLDTPTGAPNFDDRIATKELRLTFEDLLPPWFGNSEKVLFFEGDGGRYKVIFEVNKSKSSSGQFSPSGDTKGGPWGVWYHLKKCNSNSYAYGFKLRVEPPQNGGDDTALNGIRIYCRDRSGQNNHEISSGGGGEGYWGNWGGSASCSNGQFLVRYKIKVEDQQGEGDDTAANDITFRCSDNREISVGNGGKWGNWKPGQYCENGYICGFRTRVENKQGDGDDTALNDISVVCCRSQEVKIKNRAWGKCLNLQKPQNKNGGLPNVWDCVTHPDQEWRIEDIGSGFVKIKNREWGKCLNLQKPQNKNGGLPNVWDCVTHPDQEWRIEDIGSGIVKIKNRAWGKCLNLQKPQNKNGGLPNVWDCVTHPDQEWRIYSK